MSRSLVIQVDVLVGEGIKDVAKDMVKLAAGLSCSVSTDFNGVQLTAKPHTDPAALEDVYHSLAGIPDSIPSSAEQNHSESLAVERYKAKKLLEDVMNYWRLKSVHKGFIKDQIRYESKNLIRHALYPSREISVLKDVMLFWDNDESDIRFADLINNVKDIMRSKENSDENREALQSAVESITHPEIMGSKVDPTSLRGWIHELVDAVIDEATLDEGLQ